MYICREFTYFLFDMHVTAETDGCRYRQWQSGGYTCIVLVMI